MSVSESVAREVGGTRQGIKVRNELQLEDVSIDHSQISSSLAAVEIFEA